MQRVCFWGRIMILSLIAIFSSVVVVKADTRPVAPLVAAGSGVNLAITRLLVAGFVEGDGGSAIEVPGSIGTQGAIKAVAEGAIALGLISRPLKDEEKKAGMVERPYARVAMVIGAHPTVLDNDISDQQFIEVIQGTRTTWRDGKEIIVQVREKFDSGFQILGKAIPGFNEVYWQSLTEKRWHVAYNDQDANRALATTPYAIGVTDAGMVASEGLPIKMLKYNGITPSLDTLENGTYPLVRQLLFLYRDEQLTEELRRFLGFVFSEKGAAILRAHNYLPIP